MGLFDQFLSVIEWQEFREDLLFWKFSNTEIKKNSRLVVRPGQDAIFLYNGKIEGIFKDEGNYEVETQIIPVLSTLKGFKFGFNSGLRAEVLFVNTKEVTIKWGTKSPINVPSPRLVGGIPIRSFGTFSIKISDYVVLIDKIAGVKQQFSVDDVKERVLSVLDQLLMKWIVKEGKDLFNLQISSFEIGSGIKEDLDMQLQKIGFSVTDFSISSFNYPEEVQRMVEKTASFDMVRDVSTFQKVGMADALSTPGTGMTGGMSEGMGMAAGIGMMHQMMNDTSTPKTSCKNCGVQMDASAKFCSNCGMKVVEKSADTVGKFCSQCGAKLSGDAKFCLECGAKLSQ